MISIPADEVRGLRRALYTLLASAADDVATAASWPGRERRGECAEWVAHFDVVRGLLDATGWTERDPETDISLDLGRHWPAILAALREHLEGERKLMNTDDEGKLEAAGARVAVIEALISKVEGARAPALTIVPPELTGLLRESLMESLPDVAKRIERAEIDAGAYPEPLHDLDAYRAALDAIGWTGEATGPLDVQAHRWALTSALSERLATARYFAAEQGDGAQAGRQRASGVALAIETFMRAADLEVPEQQDATPALGVAADVDARR